MRHKCSEFYNISMDIIQVHWVLYMYTENKKPVFHTFNFTPTYSAIQFIRILPIFYAHTLIPWWFPGGEKTKKKFKKRFSNSWDGENIEIHGIYMYTEWKTLIITGHLRLCLPSIFVRNFRVPFRHARNILGLFCSLWFFLLFSLSFSAVFCWFFLCNIICFFLVKRATDYLCPYNWLHATLMLSTQDFRIYCTREKHTQYQSFCFFI